MSTKYVREQQIGENLLILRLHKYPINRSLESQSKMFLELEVTPLSWPPKCNFIKHVICYKVPIFHNDTLLIIKEQETQQCHKKFGKSATFSQCNKKLKNCASNNACNTFLISKSCMQS